jgi:putative membrane protein
MATSPYAQQTTKITAGVVMRIFIWLLRVTIFCVLFAFALNNRHDASVNWFFASEVHAPMIFMLLAAFALGGLFGALVMVPSWWRYRTLVQREADQSTSRTAETIAPSHMALQSHTPIPRDGL